ncbi:MAG TPA: alpha/beta hydrolase [Longimicrobiales bacterium]|nr:alpha/beta hydrolase [Longimicrobiales bacterium]
MIWAFLLAYGTVVVIAFLLAERVIFQPPPPSYTVAGLPIIRVPVTGTDSVAVLHLPDEGARYTIIFSHGNAEDLGHLQPILAELRRAGAAVIAYDYRGYGLSTRTRPGVRTATEDVEAVYEWAVGQGIDPATVVLHGRSVGSGPALELAARREVAGVILESAFTSAYRVLTRVRLLPFDPFPNIVHIRGVRRPVLVIHGTRDEVIPFAHGRRLHDAAPGPRVFYAVEGAGHNDLMYVAGDAYRHAIAAFLRSLDDPAAAR